MKKEYLVYVNTSNGDKVNKFDKEELADKFVLECKKKGYYTEKKIISVDKKKWSKPSLLHCSCGNSVRSVYSYALPKEGVTANLKKIHGYGYCWKCKKMMKLEAKEV